MSENQNGATVIMVMRHGEKPHTYNGQAYDGVNATGTVCGHDAAEHLVTLGWERTGGLVSLFSPPRVTLNWQRELKDSASRRVCGHPQTSMMSFDNRTTNR